VNAPALSRRTRPVLPLLAALCALLATLMLPRPWAVALLGAVALPRVLTGTTARRGLTRRLLRVAPLAFVALIARAWSTRHTDTLAVSAGALLALRIVVAAIWASWLSCSLRPRELDVALRQLGLPTAFVDLLASTRRFARQLEATLITAWSAGALRGGLLSPRALAHTVGAVAGVVVLRSLDRSEQVIAAQALRGGALHTEPEAP
jgi:energy-coupling factor transporter transmembrane protein EcfT